MLAAKAAPIRTEAQVATRQERIDAFNQGTIPPADQPLELLCEDHVGTYVIPFLCHWRNGNWQNVETDKCIEARVLGWRAPGRPARRI
jgi:hypothetical protein